MTAEVRMLLKAHSEMTLYRLVEVSTERVYLLPTGDLYIDRRPVIIPPGLPHSLIDPPVCLGPFDTMATREGDLIFSEEMLDLLEAVPGILSLAQEMGSLLGRGGEACSAAELNGLCAGQREMDSCVVLILLTSTITLSTAVSVRLVDGGSRCAGRVEVNRNDQWGTVCDFQWDMTDAGVVCRELGCGEAVGTPKFGPGSGPISMGIVWCRGSESALTKCRFSSNYGRVCTSHDQDVGVTCSVSRAWRRYQETGQYTRRCGNIIKIRSFSGELTQSRLTVIQIRTAHRKSRLTGGPHLCSGRVEVVHGDTWGTVCDADFDQQDAEVVCRELDCGLPVEVLGGAAFGRGEDQVWSEELQCRGDESQIHSCPTSPSLKHNCSHDSDVGLVCAGYRGARLVNNSCSGRVELQYLSEWGTVCDVSWDMRAASVLCGQLKCGSAVAVVGSDWFGEGSGRILADVFDCQGNKTHLSQCPISSWSRAACSHKQDAGVICNGSSLVNHDGRVRLSGGMECEGEVEVYFRQDWRRVLLDSWSASVASVICRQLGCGSVFSFSSSSPSSPEHSHTCVTGFNCTGSEAHLGNCSSAQPVNCSSREQLSVTCSGKFNSANSSIRLVGSGGDCAGRLEVFHSGSWGTVSDDLWDIEDAQVVCRQLQCGVALSAPVPAQFGPGTGPIWLNEVECEGNETSLWNCSFQLCGEDECGHKDDVGVVCSDHLTLRLSGGNGSCSGRLEVYHNSEWGSVCVDLWDVRDAQVVCRQLGCGPVNGSSVFGAGSGTVWLNRVKCRGNEIHLWDCPHSLKSHTDCSHRQRAGVTCAEMSVPTTTTTTTTTTTPTTAATTPTTTVKSTAAVPPIYPVSLLVLGVVLFLVFVLLVVLLYQNRRLRRVLSKRRRKTLTEAVYEEIDRRYVTSRNDSAGRGSIFSEEYEDVDEDLLSGKRPEHVKCPL
ncbi:hypothetical protein NFI96_001986 [Prochilodus magdalenae]|nr:hypothetical protein NFI96_001986 [Prochilodus magdalenae]